ncbi:hypothetical protein [Pseudodesulfovibrio sp. S3]|uniref:hypothetical protein n=1 Tax=Pseudodesulfovibrio sp. S3 TaxID=2283629 RepID=UPI000FEB6894|nr:hypothetical protein [Pseudodesulfovibrio sp. S3]RWU03844.1 hypothetical protein DWB63_10340 [Pseudodesulfovibrio sp. S3]
MSTEVGTEIAAVLGRGKDSTQLAYPPAQEDIDASKFGLNLFIGSLGSIVGGKAVLGDKGLGSSSRTKLSYDKSTGTWKSPAGLVYGDDPNFGNRIKHVLAHGESNPKKAQHSVFNVEKHEILGLVDEAWKMKGNPRTEGAVHIFEPNMNKVVGTNGETSIRIVVRKGTCEIISSYPIK